MQRHVTFATVLIHVILEEALRTVCVKMRQGNSFCACAAASWSSLLLCTKDAAAWHNYSHLYAFSFAATHRGVIVAKHRLACAGRAIAIHSSFAPPAKRRVYRDQVTSWASLCTSVRRQAKLRNGHGAVPGTLRRCAATECAMPDTACRRPPAIGRLYLQLPVAQAVQVEASASGDRCDCGCDANVSLGHVLQMRDPFESGLTSLYRPEGATRRLCM